MKTTSLNFVTILFLGLLLFVSAVSAQAQTYHPDDKEGLRAFLRQPSAEAGKINAQWLGVTLADTANWQTNEGWVTKIPGLVWNNATPKRLTEIGNDWCACELAGYLDAKKWKMLETLYCDGNQLTALDVSGCTALKILACERNRLTTLNVSSCTALEFLNCQRNQLTHLDAGGCKALTVLLCEDNQLTALDVDKCTALETLWCFNNLLTTLNVSGCTALEILECHQNQLTNLDISGCTALKELICAYNQLTTLDVNGCKKLTRLGCINNHILLSDLFVVSEIIKKNSGIGTLGTQTLPQQSAIVGVEVVFKPPQNVFNGIYTHFVVTKEGNSVPISDYSVRNGKITFHTEGVYMVTMTNAEIVSAWEPACLTIEYEVKMLGISETSQTNPLNAWASNGLLYVTGLSEGRVWSVYNIMGALVHQSVATGNEVAIPLNAPGVYIVTSENRRVKVVYH